MTTWIETGRTLEAGIGLTFMLRKTRNAIPSEESEPGTSDFAKALISEGIKFDSAHSHSSGVTVERRGDTPLRIAVEAGGDSLRIMEITSNSLERDSLLEQEVDAVRQAYLKTWPWPLAQVEWGTIITKRYSPVDPLGLVAETLMGRATPPGDGLVASLVTTMMIITEGIRSEIRIEVGLDDPLAFIVRQCRIRLPLEPPPVGAPESYREALTRDNLHLEQVLLPDLFREPREADGGEEEDPGVDGDEESL